MSSASKLKLPPILRLNGDTTALIVDLLEDHELEVLAAAAIPLPHLRGLYVQRRPLKILVGRRAGQMDSTACLCADFHNLLAHTNVGYRLRSLNIQIVARRARGEHPGQLGQRIEHDFDRFWPRIPALCPNLEALSVSLPLAGEVFEVQWATAPNERPELPRDLRIDGASMMFVRPASGFRWDEEVTKPIVQKLLKRVKSVTVMTSVDLKVAPAPFDLTELAILGRKEGVMATGRDIYSGRVAPAFVDSLLSYSPNLTRLDLQNSTQSVHHLLELFWLHYDGLTHLTLRGSLKRHKARPFGKPRDVLRSLSILTSLAELTLCDFVLHLDFWASLPPKLRQLTLNGCRGVNAIVHRLVDPEVTLFSDFLCELNLRDCDVELSHGHVSRSNVPSCASIAE